MHIGKAYFADLLPRAAGEALDRYFEKEGWTLQLWCDSRTEGYQVFFGRGVQVDNLYEYGFPYLYDRPELIDFAVGFINRRIHPLPFGLSPLEGSSVNGTFPSSIYKEENII